MLDSEHAVRELDIEGLLKALVDNEVEFLVIGGVAVGFHGYPRATKDLDVVPNPDPENLERLAKTLQALQAQIDGAGDFREDELPDPLDPGTLALGGNWVLETRLGRFDIMQWLGDTELWPELHPNAIDSEIDGLPIMIISYDDLVALKEHAGRGSDLEDLKRLAEARDEDP